MYDLLCSLQYELHKGVHSPNNSGCVYNMMISYVFLVITPCFKVVMLLTDRWGQ